MRRKKLLVCGLLSLFTLGSVSAVILAHTLDAKGTFANANQNQAQCELVWDNTSLPTLQDGKYISTAKGGVTQLVYEGVNANRGNNHVVLDLGGKISNTGIAFDPVTGLNGIINSIQSVTVWFEDKAGTDYLPDPEDYYGSEIEVDYASMILTAGTNNNISNVKATTYLTSGVPVDLTKDPHLLADHFYLSFSKGYNCPDDAVGTCEITKIAISATMEVRYDVTIKDNAGTSVEYYYVNGNVLGEKIEKVHPDDNNHPAGTKIALKYTATDGTSLTKENITVEGATLSSVTLDGDSDPTLVVTIGNSDAKITINEYTPAAVNYPAEEYNFIGQHKVYNPSTSAWVDLDMRTDGTYTLGGVTGEYTPVDANHATFAGSGKNRAIGVYIKHGFTVVEHAKYKETCDNIWVGDEAELSPTLDIYLKADNNWEGYVGKLADKVVFVYRDCLVVDGVDYVIISDNYGPSVTSESKIIRVSQAKASGTPNEEYDLPASFNKEESNHSGVKTLSVYLKQVTGHEFRETKKDSDIYGIFTCADKPDLILDGFYHYTWGQAEGFHTVKTWNPLVIVLEDETVLKINKAENTYVEAAKDPLKDGTQRVYTNGTVTFTFDGNGNVLDSRTGKTSQYKFDEYTITGSAALPYNEDELETYRTLKYNMTISPDAQTLTLTSYVEEYGVSDFYDYVTTYSENPLGTDPIVLTLQA